MELLRGWAAGLLSHPLADKRPLLAGGPQMGVSGPVVWRLIRAFAPVAAAPLAPEPAVGAASHLPLTSGPFPEAPPLPRRTGGRTDTDAPARSGGHGRAEPPGWRA